MTGAARTEEDRADVSRGPFRLLCDPVFGLYFIARTLSTAGIWIHNIVAAVLVYELSGSALAVGMVSVAQFGPQLVLGPLSGALADRGDRKHLVVAGRLVVGLGSGGLGVWVMLAGQAGLPGAWPVIASGLVVGLGLVLVAPAQHALLPALVRRNELATAIALNFIPPTLARAAGPAIGALVAFSVGPAAAFGIAACASLAFALLILLVRVDSRARGVSGADQRVRAGLAYLRVDRGIVLLLSGVVAIGWGADPVITLTPALSDQFGRGAQLVGVFASAFGVGAGAAFVYLGLLRRWMGLPRLATTGLLLLAGGNLLAGTSPVPTGSVLALAAAGTGMTLSVTSLGTLLQSRLPDRLRGRVMALWSIGFLGSRPLAAAVSGGVADVAGPSTAYVLVATGVFVASWLARPSALARHPVPRSDEHERRESGPAKVRPAGNTPAKCR